MKRILTSIAAIGFSILSNQGFASIDSQNLTLKKIKSHEIQQYEVTASESLLSASTLVLYGRDGLSLFSVSENEITLKSEYPHSHFASDDRNTVEYTLSENGRSLLSVDFSGNITVWQITDKYKLVEKQVTGFNPYSLSMSGHLTSSVFYSYDNSEKEVTKFTPYYWDAANFSITKGSTVTINDEAFNKGKHHHYPDLGLVLHISEDSLSVYDLNKNYQQIFNESFDFVTPGKISSAYDPVNNTLLLHNYDKVIELTLTNDYQVANHREVSRSSFLPHDLGVRDLLSTDNRLFAKDFSRLLELTLTEDNTYSATEICTGCAIISSNFDKETLRFYEHSPSLRINTINSDGSFSSIERQTEQNRLKTRLSNLYPNRVIGDNSSLNFNRRLFTLSSLSSERGQTFTKDIILSDQLHDQFVAYNGFHQFGKQVLYVKDDLYTLIATNTAETDLIFKKGQLALENNAILDEWQSIFTLTDSLVVFVSAGDYYLFEATDEGLSYKQVFDLNVASSTELNKHTSYIIDGINAYAFDREQQKLHHLLFENAQLSLHKTIDLPILTNGMFDYYGEVIYINKRFYLITYSRFDAPLEHGTYRLQDDGFIKEDMALSIVSKMKPAQLNDTQSLWFFDVGSYDTLDTYLFDTEAENLFSRVGEFDMYEGKFAQKGNYLHFYSQGTMVITNELSPTIESVELILNQGSPKSLDLTTYFSEQQRQDLKFVMAQTLPEISLSEQGLLAFNGQPSNSQSLIVSVTNLLEQSAELLVQLTYNNAPTAESNLEFSATTNEALSLTFAELFVDDKGLPIVVELNGVLDNMTLSDGILTATFLQAGEFELPVTIYDFEGASSKHTLLFKVEAEKQEEQDPGDSGSDNSGSDNSGSDNSDSTNSNSDNSNNSSTSSGVKEQNNQSSGGSFFFLIGLMISSVMFKGKRS